jgi:Fur family ferric uptake transcriptional regulator
MGKRTTADLDETLRSHGLRRTEARSRVLRFVHANPRPLTHGDVAKALEPEGYDYATVYRNLVDLAEAGILTRTDLGDHVWRFELRAETKNDAADHPHFICTDCGTVTCLPEGTVKLARLAKAPRAITRRQVTVQLKGLCDRCA